MSPIDALQPGIAQRARGWLGTRDETPWSGMLVWRVRLWLLALAVGLIAANSPDEGSSLAGAQAASHAACSAKGAAHCIAAAVRAQPHRQLLSLAR